MKKKKGSSKRGSNQKTFRRGMIREALSDINKEILSINHEKKILNKQISNVDTDLDKSRGVEKDLQQRLAKLLEREALLKEKKKSISQKEDKIVDRLSKIEKVKSELENL